MNPAGLTVSVNADDFGASAAANAAIVACMTGGLVTNTTAMANMPAFEEACQLARDHRFVERVGVHMNLSEGIPLTDPIRKNRRFCDAEGRFAYRRTGILFSSFDRECVVTEIGAQIARCKEYGLSPVHADSHQHVHTNLALFRLLEPALRAYGIRRVRISANMHDVDPVRHAYKTLFARYVSYRGFATSHSFGDITAFGKLAQDRLRGSCEVMVHPIVSAQGELVDATARYPLRPVLERLKEQHTITPF